MDDNRNTYNPEKIEPVSAENKAAALNSAAGISRAVNSDNTDKSGFKVNLEYANNVTEEPQPQKQSITEEIFEWLDVLVTAIISVVIIFSFIFRVATIEGPSMQRTLFSGDKVIISNLAYKPKQGDIVVVSRNIDNSVESESNSDVPIIKRVIAVEGQTVDIDFEKGIVYVDGVELKENYVNTPTNRKYDIDFPVRVEEGCVFVLGDNRNNSLDSRASWIGNNGMVDIRYILGHATIRVFPFNSIGSLK